VAFHTRPEGSPIFISLYDDRRESGYLISKYGRWGEEREVKPIGRLKKEGDFPSMECLKGGGLRWGGGNVKIKKGDRAVIRRLGGMIPERI